jgi:dihydroflavonol-4-reductase
MIIVTGANGLLGSFIVKRLLADGLPVIGIKREASDMRLVDGFKDTITWVDADVTDAVILTESFKNASVVIHAAALVSFDPREEELLFKVNVEGTKNVVNACLANNVRKLIHISSVAALGRQKEKLLLDESSKWVDSPLNSAYAKSKYLAELEVFRGMEEGLSISIINSSFILAPSDWAKSSSQIFNYIWKERNFYSGGLSNYVDVQDVAEMAFRLLNKEFNGERFIACAGSISFKDLFDQIAIRFKKKSPTIKINTRLLTVFALLEEARCRLLGAKPLITRETIKVTKENFTYSNQKSIDRLSMKYTTLGQTLDKCCDYYLRTYSINK